MEWSGLHVIAMSASETKDWLFIKQGSYVNPETSFVFEQEI